MLWQKFYGSLVPHELVRCGPLMFAVNCWQKIHNILNNNLCNSKIITTIRDPREIVHSFHRFMQCDFERAVSAGAAVHKYVLAYKKFQSPVLFVRYEDMLDEPMNTIREIDAFLELRTCERAMSEINQKFSKK